MTTRPLVILGAGRIARGLLQQAMAQAPYLEQRYGLRFPVAAVASSRFILAGEPYLEQDALQTIADVGLRDGTAVSDRMNEQLTLLHAVAANTGERAIVVDLTAAEGMIPVLVAALDLGFDVALANKKPLCGTYTTFRELTQHPRGRLAYEATVGAGLPIVETLRRLVDAGDELHRPDGLPQRHARLSCVPNSKTAGPSRRSCREARGARLYRAGPARGSERRRRATEGAHPGAHPGYDGRA